MICISLLVAICSLSRTSFAECIKGDCENGHGAIRYADGREYSGDFRDGLPHGKGVLVLPDGERYEGEFENGKYNGYGILTAPDGFSYCGQHRNGRPHGQGIIALPKGGRYREKSFQKSSHIITPLIDITFRNF